MLKRKVRQIGSSLMFVIPSDIAKVLNINNGDFVIIEEVNNGKMLVYKNNGM